MSTDQSTQQRQPLGTGEPAGESDITASVLAANRVFVAIASRALVGQRPEVTSQLRAMIVADLDSAA